jgi:HEAT repeat protein
MSDRLARQIAKAINADKSDFDLRAATKILRGEPKVANVVRVLAADSNSRVRMTAAHLALEVLGAAEAAGLLHSMLATETNADVRDAAIESLTALPSFDQLAIAAELRSRLTASVGQPELMFAIWTLARLRDQESLPLLRELSTNYQWPPGRRAAATAAALIAGEEDDLLGRLVTHDREWRVELSVAAGVMNSIRAKTDLENWARRAPDDACRLLADWALAKYYEGGPFTK